MKTQLAEDGSYILSPFRKWFGLFLIALGGGTIYLVPYLLNQYASLLESTLGASRSEINTLVMVYGIISLIFYIPGGWVADRFSTKLLFSFSMIGTGVLSIWYALFGTSAIPAGNFWQLYVIHGLFAFTTVLTFWSAFVKGVNLMGKKSEQAKLYSRCDVMRNIIGCLCGFISVGFVSITLTGAIFPAKSDLDGNIVYGSSLFFTIIFYAAIYIITGVLCSFLLPGEWIQKSTKRNMDGLFEFTPMGSENIIICKDKEELKIAKATSAKHFWKQVGIDLVQSLKNPNMWLISLLIFFTMNCYTAINGYGSTFMQGYGITGQVNQFLSYLYNYGTPILGALLFGWIASKRTKNSSQAIIWTNIPLVLLIIAMLIMVGVAPTKAQGNNNSMAVAVIGVIILCASMIFIGGSRGIYWSTMTETKIPLSIVGISSGLISIIGFSKDVWAYQAIDQIMQPFNDVPIHTGKFDASGNEIIKFAFDNQAFVWLYVFGLVNAICALIMSYIIFQKVNKGKVFTKDQSFLDALKIFPSKEEKVYSYIKGQ